MLDKSAPQSSTRASGPLAGFRIVEFAGIGPGPFACMMLADMGAEVVTLDRVGAGKNLKSAAGRGRKVVELDLKNKAAITQVTFPIPAKAGYAKFPHPASRFALTGVFVVKTKSGDVRVAATGASSSGVMRVPAIEAALKANWSAGALDSVKISANGLLADIHGSADYRANLIKVMAQRAVTAAG